MSQPSSRAAARRPPAEWVPHRACWLAWPSHPAEWGDALADCKQTVAALCAAIADPAPSTGRPQGERIELLVLDEPGELEARAALGHIPARFHRIPYGDIWLRDTAPVFTTGARSPTASRFRWTGWGGKYLFPDDRELAAAIASRAGAELLHSDLALEGGAIDSDGRGTLLTTRSCLLADSRNPGWSESEVEAELARTLAAEHVVWLDRGLRNDHTDGHIDNLARFVAPGRVACMQPAPGDPNEQALAQISRALAGARDATGQRIEVAHIPSPGAVADPTGELVPASYLNFYIGNRTVVMPRFGVPADGDAARALSALFPDRQVIALNARAVLAGGGAFHCITRDQPQEHA